MTRWADFVIAAAGLLALSPVLILIWLAVRIDSPGPALFWSQRFGRDSTLFAMPKFRSMKLGTPQLPTHLLGDPDAKLTRVGRFLRRTSLDELPQLWSVLRGDMAIVGPRPALFNQHDLMDLRREGRIDRLRPGITGWAQVNGRDELVLTEKVRYEKEYLTRRSWGFDLRIIWLTARRVFARDGISH